MGNKQLGFKFYQTEKDFRNNTITVIGITREEWEREEKRMSEVMKSLIDSIKPNEPTETP